MIANGAEKLHVNNTGQVIVNGTTAVSSVMELNVNGDIYGTSVYIGNGTNNFIGNYSGNMLIYAQDGLQINLGGGIGSRQNDVVVGKGYLYVNNNGDPAAFTVNVFPFSTISSSTFTPDAIIASKNTSNTPGSLLLHSTDTSVSAGQTIGVLQYGVRADSSNSYVSSQIVGRVFNAPSTGASGGGILELRTSTTSSGATPTTRMTIDNNGNVNIGGGTVTPAARLDVDGTSYFKGDFYSAKTGSIGTSNMIEAKVAGTSNGDALIKIGDVNDYWGGSSSYSQWNTTDRTLIHGVHVGINVDPKNMLHLFKGNLYLESSGLRDANGDYGAAGQNLKSKGQGTVEWSWEKMTLVSTFFASSFQSGSIIYMPVNGTTSEQTTNQYYNNFVAPYNGRVRQIRIKHISGSTPTATSFASFRVYVNGSLSSSQTPTTTGGGASGMMGVYEYSDTDATFSAGDRVQFAYVASGSTGHIYGATATFIIEYTENS